MEIFLMRLSEYIQSIYFSYFHVLMIALYLSHRLYPLKYVWRD